MGLGGSGATAGTRGLRVGQGTAPARRLGLWPLRLLSFFPGWALWGSAATGRAARAVTRTRTAAPETRVSGASVGVPYADRDGFQMREGKSGGVTRNPGGPNMGVPTVRSELSLADGGWGAQREAEGERCSGNETTSGPRGRHGSQVWPSSWRPPSPVAFPTVWGVWPSIGRLWVMSGRQSSSALEGAVGRAGGLGCNLSGGIR